MINCLLIRQSAYEICNIPFLSCAYFVPNSECNKRPINNSIQLFCAIPNQFAYIAMRIAVLE